jgi:4-hydroxy-3-polyprenylbenzoate decarboxylase
MTQIASLAQWLETLDDLGLLQRVDAATDPALRIAELVRDAIRQTPEAQLYTRVVGREMPVALGLLASERHVAAALGEGGLEAVEERIETTLCDAQQGGWYEKLLAGAGRGGLAKYEPRSVRSAACQQIVRLASDVDLKQLPALQSLPREPGPVITAGVVAAGGLAAGEIGPVGRSDLVVLDEHHLAVAWDDDDAAAVLARQHAAAGQAMAVAVSLGGPPALLLAAMAPLGPSWPRWQIAGLLRGRSIDLVKGRSVDLPVPADADLVIEGLIEPETPHRWVGPLADALGGYAPIRRLPVLRVTAVTHRANPVFPAMIPGPGSGEMTRIARTLQRLFRKTICRSIPGLVDFELPAFGGAEAWAALAVEQQYPGHARRLAREAWGYEPFRRCRYLVFVDGGVDVRDPDQLGAAVVRYAAPGRDMIRQEGPSLGKNEAAEAKMAIDATRKK